MNFKLSRIIFYLKFKKLRRFTKYANHPNVVALTKKVAAHYIAKGSY